MCIYPVVFIILRNGPAFDQLERRIISKRHQNAENIDAVRLGRYIRGTDVVQEQLAQYDLIIMLDVDLDIVWIAPFSNDIDDILGGKLKHLELMHGG